MLDDDDSAAMIERFTALLSAAKETVQLASCRAIGAILKLGDVSSSSTARNCIS